MATDLGKKPVKSAGAKHDAFVLAQLARAEKRIRALDLAAALFGFAALGCAFVVAAALCDRAWSLPAWVRQLSLGGFLLGGAVYLYVTLARPLWYRVNPYYAAQHVEHTMPGAKNSVINWLDLQQEKLPPAIRAAVGQKAAKDLSQADLDQAFNTRRLAWAGGAAAACTAGLLACFVWLGGDAFFQLQRIFTPFSFSSEPRTTITITRPVNGDDTVTIRHPVTITAHIEGKIPDPKSAGAVKLLVRYQENEPYLDRLMRQDGSDFTVSLAAGDVRDGFLYKVVAGDMETPEYRISVRSTPLLTSVQATYHFRPYVARDDEEHYGRSPFKLSAWRGTEITLFVRTNRPVKEAYFTIEDKDGKQSFTAEKVEDDPRAFKVKHIFDKNARYRLEYTTPDEESYADPNFQELVAVPDLPPQPVVITVPGRDTQLPCNGMLQVEGAATDDIGVKNMTLQMRVTKVAELRGKPYRSDKELRLSSGGYPLTLAYKDFVDLRTVQTPDGKLLALQPGMELEYWLEAGDAGDYPKPNVSESKHYRVKLLPPEKDPEQLKNQRDQAKQEQQQHEAKQNEALKKEDQARHEEEQRRKEDEQRDKENLNGTNKSESGNQGTKENSPPKQPNEAANPDPKKDADTHNTKEKVEQALKDRQNEQKNGDKGEAKSDPKEAAGKPKGDGSSEQRPPSESKPDIKPDERKDAAADKPAGPKSDPKNSPSETKPEGKADPMQSSGMNKPEPASRPDAPKSEPKNDPKAEPKAEPKNQPAPQQKNEAAQHKPEGKNTDQMCTKGECRQGGENPDSKPAMEKKDVTTPTDKSAGKNDGKPQPGDDSKGQPKSGGNPAGSAENKPAPQKEDVAKADPKEDKKPGNGSQTPQVDPKDAKPEDVAKRSHDLSSDYPPERKEAAQDLQKIAEQAKDPKAREMAEKALEQAGQKPPSASENKSPPEDKKSDGNGDKVSAAKGNNGMKPGETGTPKSSEPQKQQVPPSDSKNLGQPQIEEQSPPSDDPAKREELRKKLAEEMRKNGHFDEKAMQDFLKANGYKSSPPNVAANKERPPFVPEENLLGPKEDPLKPSNKPADDKATMLQLRKLQEAVDKKTLEKAGITPEQWQKFLQDYAELAKRQDPAATETLPASQNTGRLNGTGGTRTNPGAVSNANDPRSTDRVKPPPGYDDSWKLFTQKRSSSTDNK
jgi:collagen type III alpha